MRHRERGVAVFHDALSSALREEWGEVIVAVFTLSEPELQRLEEALDMIGNEITDAWEAIEESRRLKVVT